MGSFQSFVRYAIEVRIQEGFKVATVITTYYEGTVSFQNAHVIPT